jgi:hypothetical protein
MRSHIGATYPPQRTEPQTQAPPPEMHAVPGVTEQSVPLQHWSAALWQQ